LENVSWNGYKHLLDKLGDANHVRLTYDNGRLEIMSPSDRHEYLKSLLGHLMGVLTEELDLKYISFGSSTLKREQTSQGAEPDDCFYITNADKVIGKVEINLSVDPPPDLAIEIDLSNRSKTKFPIYANIGVPEIWRYKDGRAQFYRLTEGSYQETTQSGLFPFITSDVLSKFLNQEYIQDFNTVKREFRKWIQKHKPA
jgi:Uma2 family endonuclease